MQLQLQLQVAIECNCKLVPMKGRTTLWSSLRTLLSATCAISAAPLVRTTAVVMSSKFEGKFEMRERERLRSGVVRESRILCDRVSGIRAFALTQC